MDRRRAEPCDGLHALCQGRKVSWSLIRGHNGHPQNQRCDAIAVAAARAPSSSAGCECLHCPSLQRRESRRAGPLLKLGETADTSL
ncbi:MAG: RNase H family protein [Sphingomonadaceae bacterium]